MDLRAYYKQLRDTEATIADEHVVVVSMDTPDGGKAGVFTEVSRSVAAKLIVERRARLAGGEESEGYHRELKLARARVEQAAAAERMQLTVISEAELRTLRERNRKG